jgi:hypothetical protein
MRVETWSDWIFASARTGLSPVAEVERFAIRFAFEADVAALYGEQFAEVLNVSPRSAFSADGLPITVQKRQIIL